LIQEQRNEARICVDKAVMGFEPTAPGNGGLPSFPATKLKPSNTPAVALLAGEEAAAVPGSAADSPPYFQR